MNSNVDEMQAPDPFAHRHMAPEHHCTLCLCSIYLHLTHISLTISVAGRRHPLFVYPVHSP